MKTFLLMVGMVATGALPCVASPLQIPRTPALTEDIPADQQADPRHEVLQLLFSAQDLLADEEYEAAIPMLEKVIDMEPSRLSAWAELGWAHWFLGDQEKARDIWSRLRLLNPEAPLAYNLLASYHLGQNELKEAIALYRKSLSLDPDQRDARLNLGRVYSWLGYLEEATALLQPLFEEDPDRMDVRLDLARTLTSNWDYENALPHWEYIRAIVPDYPEYMIHEATCRLHLGQLDQAKELALEVLEREGDAMQPLHILADAEQFGGNPGESLAYLNRMLPLADKPADHVYIVNRLLGLLEDLTYEDPERYPYTLILELGRDAIATDPKNVGSHIAFAEQHLEAASRPDMPYSSRHYLRESERLFKKVLEEFNPRNLRCQQGLFQVYMAMQDWDKAAKALDMVRTFNPRDPYLHYHEATLYARKGDYGLAYEALDKLERAGRRGAVAMVFGHGLGPSEFGQVPSADEFREQLLAMQQAGYTFITPAELKRYFEEMDAREDEDVDMTGPVDRIAMLTFDDVLLTSLIYGTEPLLELGIVCAQHIIVANTDRGEAYLGSWDVIRKYAETGAWIFGSHSYDAHRPYPVSLEESDEAETTYKEVFGKTSYADEQARYAYPFGNRIWQKDKERVETSEEFRERLLKEYRYSQQRIEEELGVKPMFFAYPFGEIGQEAYSNERNAIDWHKDIGSTYYDMGFIQSYFAHAVNGDDPMLYQRHEPALRASGEEVVRYFITKHPVHLAQRTRLKLAADQGNHALVKATLAAMREANYPEYADDDLDSILQQQLVTKMPRSTRVENEGDAFAWTLSDPAVRLMGEYFEDNLDGEYTRFSAGASVNLAPNVTLDARGGAGTYEQNDREGEDTTRILSVDEQFVIVAPTTLFPNGVTLSGDVGMRILSGDADDSVLRAGLQAQGRMANHWEWMGRVDHDAVEAASAMVADITQSRGMGRFLWNPVQRMDVWFTGQFYDFSDGNTRQHLEINPTWMIKRGSNFRVGGKYEYITSDEDRLIYWTPYQSHNVYAEATLRGGRPGLYYSLDFSAGLGKEDAHPSVRRELEEAGGDVEDLDWQAVYGVNGYLYYNLTERMAWTGQIGYFESPSYNQMTVVTTLEFQF
jgi:tetratricopeptide (TPR) repeat protein